MANSGFIQSLPANSELAGAGFNTATDSLKILSDGVDLVEGVGFNVGTDSLKVLSDQMDLVPKTTDVVSKCSVTLSGKLLEFGSTGTPSINTIVGVNAANTFSAWVLLGGAALPNISYLASVMIYTFDPSTYTRGCVELGIGDAGSEVTIARWSFSQFWYSNVAIHQPIIFILPIPIKLAAGTKLSARVSEDAAGVRDYEVCVQHYEGLEV